MYQKKILLGSIMGAYNLEAPDIARETNISDSLTRKHIDRIINCPLADVYPT